MSNDTALNTTTASSEYTSDEDDLTALKLQDSDLDHFAAYFELASQGNSQIITVLVGLLQRLRGVERLRQQKQSGIWIEDIVSRLTHRLYTRCEPGLEAASRFGTEASDLTENILSDALLVPNEL
jgi:hypothetical protein